MVRVMYVRERSLYSMRSLILSEWRERRMGVIWQDFGALTTVRFFKMAAGAMLDF